MAVPIMRHIDEIMWPVMLKGGLTDKRMDRRIYIFTALNIIKYPSDRGL